MKLTRREKLVIQVASTCSHRATFRTISGVAMPLIRTFNGMNQAPVASSLLLAFLLQLQLLSLSSTLQPKSQVLSQLEPVKSQQEAQFRPQLSGKLLQNNNKLNFK